MTVKETLKSLIQSQFGNLGTVIIGGIFTGIFTLVIIPSIFTSDNKLTPYRNPEQGINAEYPEKWTQQKDNDLWCPGVIFNSPYEKDSDSFRERVKVCVEDLKTSLTLQEYSDKVIQEITKNNIIIEQPKPFTVGNKEGIKVVYKNSDQKQKMEVWTIKNNKAYVLTYTAEINKYKKFLKQAERIIRSFSFT